MRYSSAIVSPEQHPHRLFWVGHEQFQAKVKERIKKSKQMNRTAASIDERHHRREAASSTAGAMVERYSHGGPAGGTERAKARSNRNRDADRTRADLEFRRDDKTREELSL